MEALFQESKEEFENIVKQLVQKLYSSEHSATELEKSVDLAKNDLKSVILNSEFNFDQVGEILKERSFDSEKVNCLVKILEENKHQLLYNSLVHYNSTYGETIEDFNWIVKLILGNCELKTLRYPLVQLIFCTLSTNGEHKTQTFDINKDVLKKFIDILESVDT